MKRTGSAIGVGGSSILVIFVLLCLTTFATLSLVSANADLKLTRKTADAATAYYEADAKAQQLLAKIDGHLKKAMEAGYDLSSCERELTLISGELASPDGLTLAAENGTLSVRYDVPITDSRSLQVGLRVLDPAQGAGRYELTQWLDVPVGVWVEDESVTLWDGGLAALPES